jgi:hypothetical protein
MPAQAFKSPSSFLKIVPYFFFIATGKESMKHSKKYHIDIFDYVGHNP